MKALATLGKAGGWPAPSIPTPPNFSGDIKSPASTIESTQSAGPTILANSEGLRRPVCDLVLIIFHLQLSNFTSAGVDVLFAQKVLNWNLRRFSSGEFLFLSFWSWFILYRSSSPGVDDGFLFCGYSRRFLPLWPRQITSDSIATPPCDRII